MKKLLLLHFFIFCACLISIAQPSQIQLISSQGEKMEIEFSFSSSQDYDFVQVTTPRGEAVTISSPNGTPIIKRGAPNLPKFTTSLIVSDKQHMQVEVLSADFTEIQNIHIAPSKGKILRTQNPADVPYVYGKEYEKNKFYPAQAARLAPAYVLRDFRGQSLHFQPFQYNPATQTLRVYHSIRVKVSPTGKTGENLLQRTKTLSGVNAEFRKIYQEHFLNFDAQKYTPLEEEGKMLIIAHSNYIGAMEDFVNWKKQKGMPVELIELSAVGSTANDISTYVSNYYNNQGLTYLLLVGDAEHIPPMYKSGDSDAAFGHIAGDDSYAEVFVGRFSAQSLADAETQVMRSINYEKYPDPAADWYAKHTLIASSEGPGDDGEYDYQHMQNIRTDLMNFTYIAGDELYDGSQGGQDASGNPSASDLANVLNQGRGHISYVGHGSDYSFVTTGFNVSDVNNLTNDNMLPFIFDVACVNGNFSGQTCFAEAWMRATNGANPTGAIAIIASTINQSWNPPMDGQDAMADIMTEAHANNIKRTFAGITINGCMQMNDNYGAQGDEMTDTWTIFGDPSIMVRTAQPTELTATHQPVVLLGISSFNVQSQAEGATVCLSMDNEILATAKIQDGAANLEFTPLTMPGIATLTITAFNKVPYIQQLEVIPADGPYVILDTYEVNDGETGNSQADFNENITLDVSLKNVGQDPTSGDANATLSLSETDNFVAITTDTKNFGQVDSNQVVTRESAFALSIADGVPDQHSVSFNVEVRDQLDSVWNSPLMLKINAPNLSLSFAGIDDSGSDNPNGRLDPGETVDLYVEAHNTGHAALAASICELSSASQDLTINTTSVNTGEIAVDGTVQAVFSISVSPDAPIGSVVELVFELAGGEYSARLEEMKKVGLIVEDWETNDFSQYEWYAQGTPWEITTNNPQEGTYAAQSGTIPNNASSELLIDLYVTANDEVAFFKKVSSEASYDFLKFYIDGQEKGSWSGEIDWSEESYPVTTGQHTLRWVYSKDSYMDDGMDCAFLDFIQLPPHTNAPKFTSTPEAVVDIDSLYEYEIHVTDKDPNDQLEITCPTKPDWLTLTTSKAEGTALLSGTPSAGDIGNHEVVLHVSDGIAENTQEFSIAVGLVIETWEDQNFEQNAWEFGGTEDWTIDTENAYEGTNSARSGDIYSNQTSILQVELNVVDNDQISFYKKVSCEAGSGGNYYDYLEFFIDNTSKGKWDGEIDWSLEEFNVTPGEHVFKWVYRKDGSVSDGEDCAWIDYIEFPVSKENGAPKFDFDPLLDATEDIEYVCEILVEDVDTEDEITIEATVRPAWLTFTDNGDRTAKLRGTPLTEHIGEHHVELVVSDQKATDTISFSITVAENTTGITQVSPHTPELNIFPNPAKEQAQIALSLPERAVVEIEVFDIAGRKVQQVLSQKMLEKGEHTLLLNVSDLTPGVYFCKLKSETATLSKRLLIAR